MSHKCTHPFSRVKLTRDLDLVKAERNQMTLTVYVCESCAESRRNNPAFKLCIRVVPDDECQWCNKPDVAEIEDECDIDE